MHQKHFSSLTVLTFAAAAVFTAGNGARAQQPGETPAAQFGVLENHGDVGAVLHPGSVEYDAAKRRNEAIRLPAAARICGSPVMLSNSCGRKCPAT